MENETLTTKQQELLKQPIATLPMSTDFISTMEQLGFKDLGSLAKKRTDQLEKLKGFHTLLIHDYVTFMERNGLGELIDP